MPGSVTYVWFTTTREGPPPILCEELCGLAHHTMRGQVIVESQEKFEAWQNNQQTLAESLKIYSAEPQKGQPHCK